MAILLHVIGDYGKPGAMDLLMVKKHEQHPTELADLKGARLITVVESGEGKRLAENLIKQLTGEDKLKARRMREDFWEFEPTHKIWLATNHKPIIKGSDYAIWRRIRLIPFEVTIPDPEQDKQLTAKLKEEAPGIFNWMVEGCLAWQREGLSVPEKITIATQNYKDEMDTIKDFIKDTCIINPLAKVVVADLYTTYISWCEENGDHPLSKRKLVSKLEEMDFEKRNSSGNNLYLLGLGLLKMPVKELTKLSKLQNFRMNSIEMPRVEVIGKKNNFVNFDNSSEENGNNQKQEEPIQDKASNDIDDIDELLRGEI